MARPDHPAGPRPGVAGRRLTDVSDPEGRDPADPAPAWTAVVLAGGRAARMAGRDKPQLQIDGRSLIAWVVDDLPAHVPVVVVGPVQPVPREVEFRREDPPFGGPVAALAAALPAVRTPLVGLVASDMPRAGALLSRLAAGWRGPSALVPVDEDGHRQPLCSILPSDAITLALNGIGDPAGFSMRSFLSRLDVTELPLIGSDAVLLRDIDVPADVPVTGATEAI